MSIESKTSLKGYVGIFQWDSGFAVGIARDPQHTSHQILWKLQDLAELDMRSPDGSKVVGVCWMTVEKNVNHTAKTEKWTRFYLSPTKDEAIQKGKEWDAEYRKAEPKPQQITFVKPPPRCEKITPFDFKLLDETQRQVLAKRYPRVMELMGKAGMDEDSRAALLRDAYVLDVAQLTGRAVAGIISPDPDFIQEFHAAFQSFSRRKRPPDLVEYELAANWIQKGYCFMPDKKLAEALEKEAGTAVTIENLKSIRKRLGLFTKHPSGPENKA